MKILFYISGHGLGHATRVFAIIKALLVRQPTLQIFIRAQLSKNIFDDLPETNLHVYPTKIDVGVIEKDIFSQDVYATLSLYSEIISSKEQLIQDELNFIRAQAIDLIVSDIPPLASEIARVAGVPIIAIGNFSWDFIYTPYVLQHPTFAFLIDEIRSSYEKTNFLLRLPFHHKMSAFPQQRDIPLVVRKSEAEPEQTRSRLGIHRGDSRSIVLIALRMENTVPLRAIQALVESDEFIILSFVPLPIQKKNTVYVIDSEWRISDFPSIVAMSDLVISKLGYGIVSECIASRTPLLYIPRDDFAEFEVLRSGSSGLLHSYQMSRDNFLQGNWYNPAKRLLSTQFNWPNVRTDGADIAAEMILLTLTEVS
jgi:UDP:flavonoid glycosyltransferase YjiC (YdhE family)